MFNIRASVRTAGVTTGIAALVLFVFAGSAVAWYCPGKGGGGNDETSNVPPSSSPGDSEEGGNDQENGDQPSGGDQSGEGDQQAPPPVVESTPGPGPAPTATGLLPAAQPAVAVSPVTAPETPAAATTPPAVKGEIGTVRNGGPGGQGPTVLAAAGDVGQSAAGQGGGLARTGFDMFPLAILGGLALGGCAFFFRRFQAC